MLEGGFLKELTTDQILELNELKAVIKKKNYQGIEGDIRKSEFFKNLTDSQKERLMESNSHLFTGPLETDKAQGNILTFRNQDES